MMKLYRLECLTEDGNMEENGYYLDRANAELNKDIMDSWPRNTKYAIKQHIVEIETED